MAGFYEPQIQSGTNEYLRTYNHASHIFERSGFANAPKFKWLFHVYFDINELYVSQPNKLPDSEIPGLLVKNINLPKYSMTIAEMNQYNRRRYVQTKIAYDPITVTFHDDNKGQIRDLWYQYFSYYYNDPRQPYNQLTTEQAIAQLNKRNQYQADISQDARWGLLSEPSGASDVLNIGQVKVPFFKSIKIYGFNQHSFTLYDLVNPIIERFEHDTYDYYQTSGLMENKMTIRYETVKYSQGALNGTDPSSIVKGFGIDGEYDLIPSPITIPGGNAPAMGPNGLVGVGKGFVEGLDSVLNQGTKSLFSTGPENAPQNSQYEFDTYQKNIIDGAKNVSTNPDTTRSQFNVPTLASTYGPTAQYGTSNNYGNPNAPKIPNPANNPIV